MKRNSDFTQGPIMGPLLSFMLPVLFAMLLQAMYGAVDLMIVGKNRFRCFGSALRHRPRPSFRSFSA